MMTEIIHTAAVFLIAMMTGMGIGSAGLMVIWLTAVLGIPQLEAQGINLIFFLISAAASMTVHLKKRHIPPLQVLLLSAAGVAAAYFGSRTAMLLPQELIRKLFGAMLTVSGSISLLRHDRKERKKHRKNQ